jgi:hypothetical protein
MSRHLMARFRHLHAAADPYAWEPETWQVGRPLGWSQWVKENNPGGAEHDIGDHISNIVHHGEQRYGLEVMPSDWQDYKSSVRPGWVWGIHQFRPHGAEKNNDPDYPEEYKGEHLNWTSPGEWDHPEGTPAEYYGYADTHLAAMRAAQDNWDAHKAHVDAQNPLKNGGGGYDINDIMRGEDPL